MIIQNLQTPQVAVPERGHVAHDASGVASGVVRSSPESAAQAVAKSAREPSAAELQRAVQTANHAVSIASSNLKFTVDSATNERIVRVVDSETGDLIRQIPSKEMLAVSEAIDQFLQRGVLLKQKA